MPKQHARLGDGTVLDRSLAAFRSHPGLASLVLVGADAQGATSVPGGAERADSVRAGLAALPADALPVLIHDAARPGLEVEVIDRLLAALEDGAAGAVPVLPVADTLAAWSQGSLGDVVDRSALVRVQTPQAFRRDAIERAHREWSGAKPSDDAQMVRALGLTVATVEGDVRLDKITYPGDLERMSAILSPPPTDAQPDWRVAVGTGFDVHRLTAGDGVWLGGVLVECPFALVGHSDADVLLHAITDALLGALGEGDIGTHFPPSDERWRRAASDQFLAHAAALIRDAGGAIEHIDATLIGERPKVGPHRAAIRARVAEICGISEAQVGIKATTTEKLGFAGREEGLAAQAAATIIMPRKGSHG